MNLLEFKNYISKLPDKVKFNFSISEPFSWRGNYSEVAFRILQKESTKSEILNNIQKAYKNEFEGYKGGKYKYNDYTPVNFEEGIGNYTDGEYCANWISKIEQLPVYKSQEYRLVNLMFPIDMDN